MNIAYFFEELKEVLSYSLTDIRNFDKYTDLLNYARHYSIGFLMEFKQLGSEEAGAIVNVDREEAEAMFDRHDQWYYTNPEYRRSYDIILNNLNFFSCG